MAEKATKEQMNLYTKMLAFQSEVSGVKKEKSNPFFGSAYFDINALLAAVKPVLNTHGLVLLQPLGYVDGRMTLTTIILDSDSGESLTWTTILPENPDAQKMGSIITYFRRYALQSLLGLEAEDDDANLASKKVQKTPAKPITGGLRNAKPVVNTAKPPFGEGADENDILG